MPTDFNKASLAWTLPWDVDWVTSVAFVGRTIVAGNNRGDLLAWPMPEKATDPVPSPTLRLAGHTNVITRLRALRDGRTLLSSSYDHAIRIWDLQAAAGPEETVELNAETRADLKRRGSSKLPPAVTAKVKTVASTGTIEGHKDWVSGLSLSSDDGLLLSGDDQGQVILWDRPASKEIRRWTVATWVQALALSPDGKQALVTERLPLVFDSGSHTGVKIWDATSGTMRFDLKDLFKKQYIEAAGFSPDGKILAVARGGETDTGKVTFLDPATGKKLRESSAGHQGGATDLAFHPDGKHLLSTGRDTVVKVWNIADGKLVKELGKSRGGQFKDWLHALAISPDGRWIAAADMAGAVQVWFLG